MIPSIRKFLLINLLLSIIVTTTLTAVGNYVLDKKDIQYHLDSLLSEAALSFQALLTSDIDSTNLSKIQHQLNDVPSMGRQYDKTITNPFDYVYEDKLQFQVWDRSGDLILQSANAPLEPLSDDQPGFSNITIHGQPWRVFTTVNEKSGLIVVLAEKADTRAELGHRIARDDVFIMLLTYPLLGLLIWIIIGKGLYPLKRITHEVSSRAATYLDPVDLAHVPVEIKSLIDELNKLFMRLQQALDREKRFAADAAHELRTPLAVLKTHAQVAMRATDDEARCSALTKLINSVDRSTHVIQQLLTLSRLVPGETHTLEDVSPVNLKDLAVEEITQQVNAALEKNIEIELVCPEPKQFILGNETALSILFRNLIDNAIRYTPENSSIKINIYTEKNQVYLIVDDNGPGIPAELRSRVFERFYRVLGTKKQGSGLGLAIVQQIANLHNGTVSLGTPPSGQGLEVKICFPKYKEQS